MTPFDFIIAVVAAFIIGKIVLAINDKDDDQPWSHDMNSDYRR